MPEYQPERHEPWQAIESGERILINSGADIRHDQADSNHYSPGADIIHLTLKDTFPAPADYYGAALHELGHWTGHPSRLNRLTHGMAFGSPAYAREEARAELASVLLAAETGIPYDPEQAAAYIKSWARMLKQDKNEFFAAASEAQKIVDYELALDRGEMPQVKTWRQLKDERRAVKADGRAQ